MNRRGFLSSILSSGIAFSVLPPAVTYARQWVKPRSIFVPCQFTQYLIDSQARYEAVSLASYHDFLTAVRPMHSEFIDAIRYAPTL